MKFENAVHAKYEKLHIQNREKMKEGKRKGNTSNIGKLYFDSWNKFIWIWYKKLIKSSSAIVRWIQVVKSANCDFELDPCTLTFTARYRSLISRN